MDSRKPKMHISTRKVNPGEPGSWDPKLLKQMQQAMRERKAESEKTQSPQENASEGDSSSEQS